MKDKLKGLWEKIKGFFIKMNKKMRVLLGVAAGVILVTIIVIVSMLTLKEEPYAVLFTGLSNTETSSIMSYLEENSITEYQVNEDQILVPAEMESQLKAQLLMAGYPKSGYLYDSYFENVSSMSTTSERDTAFLIALQQRMEAIICNFNGVRSASVTIAPGKDQTYVLDDTSKVNASASVVVTMEQGYALNKSQASAIRTMVTHGVQGLTIGDVSITDNYGNTYSADTDLSNLSDGSALKLRLEQETNNKVRTSVLNVLTGIYGEDNVRVAVNSVVDVSRKIVESTEYSQPAGANPGAGLIGSETWLYQVTRDGEDGVGGAVGTTTNSDIPEYVETELELNGNENYAGSSGNREYDTNKSTTQMEVIAGTVTDVSVSVTINRNSPNASAVTEETLRDHVAMAAGIDEDDPERRISIVIAPFYEPSISIINPNGDGIQLPSWALYAAIAGLVVFLLLLVLILVLLRRSKKKKLEKQKAEEEARQAQLAAEAAAAAVTPSESGADIMDLNMEKSMELRKTVRQFAQNNPEIAAQIIKNWLKGDED